MLTAKGSAALWSLFRGLRGHFVLFGQPLGVSDFRMSVISTFKVSAISAMTRDMNVYDACMTEISSMSMMNNCAFKIEDHMALKATA